MDMKVTNTIYPYSETMTLLLLNIVIFPNMVHNTNYNISCEHSTYINDDIMSKATGHGLSVNDDTMSKATGHDLYMYQHVISRCLDINIKF